MCQLLALNGNTPTDLRFSFSGFAQRAGQTGDHVDGWGIAFFEDRGVRHFVDTQPASASVIANLIKEYPIKSCNIISHIRKATQGAVNLANCHPFIRQLWGRNWVFAHNGDLKNFAPKLHTHFHPVGTTDSELAFCWIMQELHKSHAAEPDLGEISLTLAELASHIAPHGTFNFLLSNGKYLWAHASTNLCYIERAWPFTRAHLSDADLAVDFSQETTPADKVAVIVTAPLTRDENWQTMPKHVLHVFEGGRLSKTLPTGYRPAENNA